MPLTITPLGAAGTVTGSRHLLQGNGVRILVDCGLYQERQLADRNYQRFPVDPATINAVVLTHAHLDHTGYLPKLVKEGFKGPVYCTPSTAEMLPILLEDSARLQLEDIEQKRRRHEREQRPSPVPLVPLYDQNDVANAMKLVIAIDPRQTHDLVGGCRLSLHAAGHILGATMLRFDFGSEGSVLFSGDLGRLHRPMLPDPVAPPIADLVVMEATYGDREHGPESDPSRELARAIGTVANRAGALVIPAFAIERAQEILWHLSHLHATGQIPVMPVYLDSPMAVKILEVFRHHPEDQDQESQDLRARGIDPLSFPGLTPTPTREDSKRINDAKPPFIVIAGSGMCTGGRIKHHLTRRLGDVRSMILFSGYQADGTLGRLILQGTNPVRVLGAPITVRAQIRQIQGFSGHAGRTELLDWLGRIPVPPKKVLIVHSGPNVGERFAVDVTARFGFPVEVAQYQKSVAIPR